MKFANGDEGANSTFLTDQNVPGADLKGKWIVITGANNGVRLEAAKSFAAWGANLTLACREPSAWELHPSVAMEECKGFAEARPFDDHRMVESSIGEHFHEGPERRGNEYQTNKLYWQMWVAELQSRFRKHPEYLHIIINEVYQNPRSRRSVHQTVGVEENISVA
ncbi:uncharacterized protein BDW43DRAFT_314525 [Aspergillus alliaceus]|uniref:uncharacterized protein n=1 Tax=Petromyces alliaceus TaxID=209559 RepID=UPI0012A4A131|nr:uncharacterized protein BDW43DRAFT_314525 [Aspergillus alliaceus]KAB8229877.1 hypothetical protein BDW43DRAFT_314525 [Aspergillus alliaceus]